MQRGRVKGARAPSGSGCTLPVPFSCRSMARAGATQSSKASIGNMRRGGRCLRLAACCQRAAAEAVYRGPYLFAEAAATKEQALMSCCAGTMQAEARRRGAQRVMSALLAGGARALQMAGGACNAGRGAGRCGGALLAMGAGCLAME